jgi:hypothetical protein
MKIKGTTKLSLSLNFSYLLHESDNSICDPPILFHDIDVRTYLTMDLLSSDIIRLLSFGGYGFTSTFNFNVIPAD